MTHRSSFPALDRPIRIACVHTQRNLTGEVVGAMNLISFLRLSEAFQRRGHEVDIVVNGSAATLPLDARVGRVSPARVRWDDYDMVKTFLHSGFAALTAWNGDSHPFIVSTLGSVVGSSDAEGCYFYGPIREQLFAVQQNVAARSKYVSLLTKPNADLYRSMHGDKGNLLHIPTGVDAEVPAPGRNPYSARGIKRPVAIYAGNLYNRDSQPEVNVFWQDRLNTLGRALLDLGVQLVVMGPGQTDRLDPSVVMHVGLIDVREFWNWQWHANVGIVLAQGPIQDNESSKIYYYLRTGLPVACEAPVPNAGLILETGHGTVVEYRPDLHKLAEAAALLASRPTTPNGLIPYMIAEHSWDTRAAAYARAFEAAPFRQPGIR